MIIALLVASLSGVGLASAQPEAQTQEMITIAGRPLNIQVWSNGSLQVYHESYSQGATFGTAGSGFFIAVDETIYSPYFNPFLLNKHEGPSGSGSTSNPYRVVTEGWAAEGGHELYIVQTISYVNGSNYFDLSWRITNSSGGQTCFSAYHAADLYFADNDYGIGYYDSMSGAVGGFNEARDWFMVFIPTTPADHFEEAHYTTIWDRANTGSDLQNTIDTDYIDNGAALQWDVCLSGGQSTTIGDRWSFGESEAAVIRTSQNGGTTPGEPFRQPDLLTPEITTYVPTPLNISTEAAVIGTNFLLAAIAMIFFTISSELLNKTLAENEVFFQKILKPLRSIRTGLKKIDIAQRLGRPRWFELLKLLFVLWVYGFVFSLLDPSWRPFSVTGFYLFVTMMIAYGVVGLADDIAQWLAARRLKLPVRLNVRPGNLLIIVASTAFSRTFGILPGIMFGAPEAFEIDEETQPSRRTQNNLLRIGAGVLVVLLFTAWLPTVVTTLIQQGGGPDFFLVLAGGLESLLLLIFAVTVQNIFLQMLALPGSMGHALKAWSKVAWGLFFLGATFLFLHTLLNPKGELAVALSTTSVVAFMTTIFLFLVFTVAVWAFFRLRKPKKKELEG